MKTEIPTDIRQANYSRWRGPRAVVDSGAGAIIATVEIEASPERVFRALTTTEVEQWWGHPGFYQWKNWQADLRAGGRWSVEVHFTEGGTDGGGGEFAEIEEPHKIVMTRKFEQHPLLGTSETTITYRLDPIESGTRVTVRDEGFTGRSEEAYDNAEHWERVLGWLEAYVTA